MAKFRQKEKELSKTDRTKSHDSLYLTDKQVDDSNEVDEYIEI